MPRKRSQTPRPVRPPHGLAPTTPDIPLPAMLLKQVVLQHTAPGVRDPLRDAFDIPLTEDLFWLHLGPPRSWTPYMFDVVGTATMHEATRERFRFDLEDVRWHYGLPYIILWYRRVYLEEPGVSVAIRWYPHREATHELLMPSRLSRTQATRYLTEGLRWLHALESRGRRPGPRGFRDDQDFEDTLVHLIQLADAHGQDPTQRHIATLLYPILVARNGATYSAASVEINIDNTTRLIRDHSLRSWDALVTKARQPH